ncbi:MAG: protein kinase [Chloroflexi bacterium]|nr:protein kinase [Chloroflexota bacterium]
MPTDFTGQMFGSYKLVAQLGRGGMASVYRGYQESIDRSVAVKILPPEFLHDPNFSQRFLAEARTLAKLTHPSILPLYDFGTANDVPYIVMPLMAKGTMADRLRAPMPLAEVVRLITPIASALDYAHQQGVIHRDIKPSNILFDQHDTPFLGDFGISKALEASSSMTGTGIVGTPDYMSPEQARGEALDGRSDIYSLGVVAYQALTGHNLFKATTPIGVMLKHATEPPPPIRENRPDIPDPVEAVIQRALAKYPIERYQTATEFAQALAKAAFPRADSPTWPEPKPANTAATLIEPAPVSRPPTGPGAPLPPGTQAGMPVAATGTVTAPPAKKGGLGGMLVGGSVGIIVGVVLVIALVVCSCIGLVAVFSNASTPTPQPTPTFTPTPRPQPTATPEPTAPPVLFFDDFEDENSGWSTFESENGAAVYESGDMAIKLFKTDWFVWSNSNRSQFSNVFINVTANLASVGHDTSFGIMCGFQDNSDYYYMAIDADGYYAIIHYTNSEDTFLTGDGGWAQSEAIPTGAASYELGATCSNDLLELYVDGQFIDSASISGLPQSDVGVFGWTNESSNDEIRFDDFAVYQLP